MSIPVDIQFRFGQDFDGTPSLDPILTDELKDRITKLITGKFEVDAQGRCVIEPLGFPFNPEFQVRDSVCVGFSVGPISISYCKDVSSR
jgi:hypothetical protein